MFQNFFLIDTAASLWAFVLFGLFAFVPGYALGWMANLLDFRRRTHATRCVLSIPLSIGIAPLLASLTWRFWGITLTWCAFGLLWTAFAAVCIHELPSFRPSLNRRTALYALIAAGWLCVGLLSLVDWNWGHRLYFSVVSYDYTMRSAVVSAISRDGIPPTNPYFFPGHTVPLRYHYYWLVPCSLVQQLSRPWVTARHAIIAGALWNGLGLLALIALFLRYVHPEGARGVHRRILIGAGLLAVTGLDIIPNLILAARYGPLPEPEWWNEEVAAWITTLLWVPHNAGALVAGMAGVLIAWHAAVAVRGRAVALFASAFCLAGCLGESIYVGVVLGAAMATWTLVALLKGWRREAGFLVRVGAVALVLAAPQVWALVAPARGGAAASATATPGHVLSLGVRVFLPASAMAIRSGTPNLVYAAFLPLNYFLEFGVFGVAGVWFLRRLWRERAFDRYRLATLTLAATSFVICTFVRSNVIASNDLGMRGMLVAQFVLLLWTVDLLMDRKAARESLVVVLLIWGVASSVYEAADLRLYPILSSYMDLPQFAWLNPDASAADRNYELRAAYARLNTLLSPDGIVQQNPDTFPGDVPWGLYADRRVVADTLTCGTNLGGDANACATVISRIVPLFRGTASTEEVDLTCHALSIAAVLVKDIDPVWSLSDSWVWQRKPAIDGAHVRVFLFDRRGSPASH